MDKLEFTEALKTLQAILGQLVQRTHTNRHHLTFPALEAVVFALSALKAGCPDDAVHQQVVLSLSEQWQAVLSDKLIPLLKDLAAYQKKARIDLSVLFDGLAELYRGTELIDFLNQVRAQLPRESYSHSSPERWQDVLRVRSERGEESLTAYNRALYRRDTEEHCRTLWLHALCDRVHGYWVLARSGLREGQNAWPLGEAFVQGLLECTKTHPGLWASTLALCRLLPESGVSNHPSNAIEAYHCLKTLRDTLKNTREPSDVLASLTRLHDVLTMPGIDACPESADADVRALVVSVLDPQDAAVLTHIRQACFNADIGSYLEAQKQFSQQVTTLVGTLWARCEALLGEPLCTTALLLLGSTSKQERALYSDIECALVYEPRLDKKVSQFKEKTQAYLHTLLRLLDVMVVSLNETPMPADEVPLDPREGVRLDASTASYYTETLLYTPVMPAGTVEEVMTFAIVPLFNQPQDIPSHAGYYSWLYGALVNPSGDSVYAAFNAKINGFLATNVDYAHPRLNQQPLRLITAWLSYESILRDALSVWDEFLTRAEPQSLKALVINPLTYGIRCLQLHLGIEKDGHRCLPPNAVLDAMLAQSLIPQGVYELWLGCLEWIAEVRYRFDNQAKKQVDKVQKPGDALMAPAVWLSAEDWAGLQLIGTGLIKPLAAWVQGIITGETPALPLFELSFLSDFFRARHSLHEMYPNHPLLKVLGDYPDETGWNPQMIAEESAWRVQLQKTLFEPSEAPTGYLVQGGDWGTECFYVQEAVGQQLFDDQGELKKSDKNPLSERSAVHQVGDVFVKLVKKPEENPLVAHQFALYLLHQRLGFQTIAPGYPLRWTVKTKKVDKVYWSWVSQAIDGPSLEAVIRRDVRQLSRLSLESYSEQFIYAFLTAQEDGQPANFMAQSTSPDTFRLRNIDSGQAFVQSVRSYSGILESFKAIKTKEYIVLKSMVFLLEDYLKQPLHPRVIEKLLLLDATHLVQSWSHRIATVNQAYEPLMSTGWTKQRTSCFMEIEGPMEDLVERNIVDLTRRLKKDVDQRLTHDSLLESLDARLANLYARWRQTIEREGGLSRFDFNRLEPVAYNRINQISYSLRNFPSLKTLQHTVKSAQSQIKDPVSYCAGISFRAMVNHEGKPRILRQRYFLELMQGFKLTQLNLSYCTVLTEQTFTTLVRANPQLVELNLSHCPILKNKEVIADLLQKHRSLKRLGLGGIQSGRTLKALFAKLPQIEHIALGDDTLRWYPRDIAWAFETSVWESCLTLLDNQATWLDLWDNDIGDSGAESLGRALAQNTTLTELDLSANKIGDSGAEALGLAQNITLTQLKLSCNKIGASGARALAQNTTLTQLNLWNNQIGASGAWALAQNTTLTQLDPSPNHIGDSGAEASIKQYLNRNTSLKSATQSPLPLERRTTPDEYVSSSSRDDSAEPRVGF